MISFVVRRLIITVLVAVTISVVGFSLLRLSGDLAHTLAGDYATPEAIARTAKAYGLDRPVYVQYFEWAGKAIRGDLGRSIFSNQEVTQLILERIGVTARLAALSLAFALCLAIPLGVLAAVFENSWIDRAALVTAVFGQAVPNFWLGLMLIILFGVIFKVLPISGSETWAHFILPTVTLGVSVMPSLMRITRTGMKDALQSDYIRTVRAKGLGSMQIYFKHALRNAILPVVSLAAVSLGFLLGGTVIIETVFALNGIGLLAYESIVHQDFPVVQSILVIISLVYIVLTFLADVINAQLDPRIRLR